jgi:drug/metabolite transporter (DMT)-like permease
VLGAGISFSSNDVLIKLLSDTYPLHQIVFFRSSISLIITLSILVPLEGGVSILRTSRLGIHCLRGLALVVANLSFFTGLAVIPLGDATAIFFVAPLLITLLSIPVLGEKVGPRRLGAVVVGLFGVLLMVRPGSAAFQIAAVLPLIAAMAYASLQVVTRKIGRTERAATLAFYIQLCFFLSCAGFGLFAGDGRFAPGDGGASDFLLRAWVWPEQFDMMVLASLGVLAAFGGYLISQAYRSADAAFLAPFEYIALPLSIFWSISIWGDWPEAQGWVGIALICGAGLYVFFREAILKRTEP